jgi:hypothetical protein
MTIWVKIHFSPFNLTLKNFENVDQEDLVMDPPDQSRGIVSASLANLSHLGIHPFQDSFPFPFQSFPSSKKLPSSAKVRLQRRFILGKRRILLYHPRRSQK